MRRHIVGAALMASVAMAELAFGQSSAPIHLPKVDSAAGVRPMVERMQGEDLPAPVAPMPSAAVTSPAADTVVADAAPIIELGSTPVGLQRGLNDPRIWFDAEYLMYWIKGAPLPFPLVTTTSAPGTNVSGALGQPATQVLYGGHDAGFGLDSGMRYTAGGWIDSLHRVGVEGQIFILQDQGSTIAANSNGAGSPGLYFPAFNAARGAERALVLSDPVGLLGGNVQISSHARLWGASVDGLVNLRDTRRTSIDVLCGFRHLDLNESLQIDNTTTDLVLGTVDVLTDRFGTSNQFYGGQIGTRVKFQEGRWLLTGTAKVALGSTHEVVKVAGQITESGALAPFPGTFPGGFYAQPTNIGSRSTDQFAVVPDLQARIGFKILPNLTGFVSYNFLYWSGVVRPGNQMDRNLNLSQSPIFGITGGVLTGPAAPQPQFNPTDFWAQGVTVGMSLSY